MSIITKGKRMEFHEAANIFPLDEENIGELASDILSQGQQIPIEVMGGKILDGRRRYLACQKAGIVPQYKEVSPSDPCSYVLSLNLHRRHLSPTQLAMVGARAREYYDSQAKERQRMSEGRGRKGQENFPDLNAGQARDHVGKVVGVSGKSIDAATKVLRNGTPSLVAAVDADQIAVSTASRAASLSDAEQDALAERAKEEAASGRKRPRPAANSVDETEEESGGIERKGVGVIRAHEAINCLTRIPKNDALRKRGFQIVTDWIRRNR